MSTSFGFVDNYPNILLQDEFFPALREGGRRKTIMRSKYGVGTRPQDDPWGLLILSSRTATALFKPQYETAFFRASVRRTKVKVTLRLTVSQSVCVGVEAK
jgi:hypothetical protein